MTKRKPMVVVSFKMYPEELKDFNNYVQLREESRSEFIRLSIHERRDRLEDGSIDKDEA